MRKYFQTLAIAGGLAASPVFAQDMPSPPGAAEDIEMSAEQTLAYETWPAERRTLYDSWPAEARVYYWTLTPPRQEVFWMLSDSDRLTLTSMGEAEQETAWTRLEDQMLASQPPVGAQSPPVPESSSDPVPGSTAEPGTPGDDTVDDHGPR